MDIPVVKVLWALAKLGTAAALMTFAHLQLADAETLTDGAGLLKAMTGGCGLGAACLLLSSIVRSIVNEHG